MSLLRSLFSDPLGTVVRLGLLLLALSLAMNWCVAAVHHIPPWVGLVVLLVVVLYIWARHRTSRGKSHE
ncbi:MAG: hypothetical protein HY897_25925 [Deltaproteobacteria bacterium]|nr:hypothetical protein [Deltaproteobacteria bacterium]